MVSAWFLINGLVEAVFGLVGIVKPTFLFFQVTNDYKTSTGPLAAEVFSFCALAYGGVPCIYIYFKNSNAQIVVATIIGALCYQSLIIIDFIRRLVQGLPTMGPVLDSSTPEKTEFYYKLLGICGIAVHFGLLVWGAVVLAQDYS